MDFQTLLAQDHIYSILVTFTFLYGAAFGSFLNVCIHRIPLKQHLWGDPPSSCPYCGAPIRWRDNIPLLGWLLLRGRCRDCSAPISVQYPLVELTAALLSIALVLRFGFTWETALLALLFYAFIVLTVIDLYHYILPDVITKPGIVIGLIISLIPAIGSPFPSWQDAFIGAVAGGGGLWLFAWSFEKLAGKEGMGLGDVKLFALIGAWMGWQALPFTLFGSALLGSIAGVAWIVIKGRDRTLPIPFGPYLVAAAMIHLFWGDAIYRWYLDLLLR